MSLPTGTGDTGVEEEINLNLITDEQLDRLEVQADNLEKKSDRIKRILADLGGMPQDLGEEDPNAPVLPRGTGGNVGFKQGQLVRGGVRGQDDNFSRQAAPFDPKENRFYQQLESRVDIQEEALDLLEAEVEKTQSRMERIAEIRVAEKQALSVARQGLGAIRDPIGFGLGKMFGIAAKFAIPVGAIMAIATMAVELIKSQFGPGGIFDVRKLVEDEAREFMFQSDLIDIDRGTIYFATTNTLNQKYAGISNTESKVEGTVKDIIRNPGD